MTWTASSVPSRTKLYWPSLHAASWQMLTDRLCTVSPGVEMESKAMRSESRSDTG